MVVDIYTEYFSEAIKPCFFKSSATAAAYFDEF